MTNQLGDPAAPYLEKTRAVPQWKAPVQFAPGNSILLYVQMYSLWIATILACSCWLK